ncbi:hypothetical protein DV736_g3883, partial [Chaetothyriales sp. CBS 134916]
MAQSNFVDNVLHEGMNPIQDEVILNSDLLADMAASPEFAYHYISTSEISIGAGYSIKLEDGEKNLYKDGIKCELSTSPESVITDITNYRGSTITSSIGTIVSENYILHMCPNKSFQFYKRLSFSDSDDDDGEGTTNSTQLGKRYGYRCINRKVGADKTCGDNPKSGNPVNSAHNCPGKAERLGKALAETRGLRFTHIFASTLQRAWITADSVQKHQSRLYQEDGNHQSVPQVAQSGLLLEQDFGSFELVKWSGTTNRHFSLPDPDTPGFKPRETAEAMKWRADSFIKDFLLPLVIAEGEETTEATMDKVVVAVVSHGLFLQQLWKNLFMCFEPGSVSLGPDTVIPSISGHQPSVVEVARWTNTAYLDRTNNRESVTSLPIVAEATTAENKTAAPANVLLHRHLRVLAINRSDHLSDLKRDGVGSSPYDFKQQSIKAFFATRED